MLPTSKRTYLGSVLLVIASLIAGAAGASLIVSVAANSFAQLLAPATRPSETRPVKTNTTRVAASRRATVSFYKVRTGATALDTALLPTDRIGNGLVITADGWLLTSAAVLSGRDPLVAVFADRQTAVIDLATVIRDEATGLAFVRVEASRSPVIDFADDTVLAPGDTLFAVDPTQVTDLTIDAGRTLPVSGKNDYVESSEKLSRRLFVSGGAPVAGTALVNEQGSAVAIYLSDGQAVPASFISTVLKSIFVNGTALRPRAGMHYVSTDLIFGVTAPGFPRSGALLTPSNKNRAVEHLSAAESAGLQDGDVILAVERDKVNADATLAELLNEYAPGARVELTVLRAGKEEKISLTLK